MHLGISNNIYFVAINKSECIIFVELDLSSCIDIPSEAFEELSRLQCLKRLNLYRTQITEKSFEKIARYLPPSSFLILRSTTSYVPVECCCFFVSSTNGTSSMSQDEYLCYLQNARGFSCVSKQFEGSIIEITVNQSKFEPCMRNTIPYFTFAIACNFFRYQKGYKNKC